jgi:hypothetical protein
MNKWTLNLTAAALTPQQVGAGTTIMAADTQGIIDDDLVGGVTMDGRVCLELATVGLLEVWKALLTGERVAVGLVNRSAGPDVTAYWDVLGYRRLRAT